MQANDANGEGKSLDGVVRRFVGTSSLFRCKDGTEGQDGSTAGVSIKRPRKDVAVGDLVEEVDEANDLKECQDAGHVHVPVITAGCFCFPEACDEIPPIWAPHRTGRKVVRGVDEKDSP